MPASITTLQCGALPGRRQTYTEKAEPYIEGYGLMLLNRVKVASTTTGTGDFTLGSAETGYQSFENGQYFYVIDDRAGNWECGIGIITGTTLVRSPTHSSNSNALVNFTANTIVFIDANADNLAVSIQGCNALRGA